MNDTHFFFLWNMLFHLQAVKSDLQALYDVSWRWCFKCELCLEYWIASKISSRENVFFFFRLFRFRFRIYDIVFLLNDAHKKTIVYIKEQWTVNTEHWTDHAILVEKKKNSWKAIINGFFQGEFGCFFSVFAGCQRCTSVTFSVQNVGGGSGYGHIKGIRNDYKRIKYSMNFIFQRKSLENDNNNKELAPSHQIAL